MTDPAAFTAAVKQYWEDPKTVSIIDKNLHELEMQMVERFLLPTDVLADIGCGDGQGTMRYATRVHTAVGVERSSTLRAKAEQARDLAGAKNLTFHSGDVLDSPRELKKYDVIVTQRLLINLASWEEQRHGLVNIHRMLKPGGRYLMIENTNDAFQVMNDVRASVGLAPVPQHWHNRFFDHDQLETFLRRRFQLLRFRDFGLYYLLTRVYVQMFAVFEGYGTNAKKDAIFERSDIAARVLFEKFGDQIEITGARAFGPIQFWALRREGTDLDDEGEPVE
jgi:SAM-dependent methyltransferase